MVSVVRVNGIVAFVVARLDEDEATAKACAEDHPCEAARDGHWQDVGLRHVRYENSSEDLRSVDVSGGEVLWYEQIKICNDGDGRMASHIARHDPARVLRSVAAMRKIVTLYAETKLAMTLTAGKTGEAAARDYLDGERELCVLKPVVRELAGIWAGHPDYEEGWRPES